METAFIGMGSNIEDRNFYLNTALNCFRESSKTVLRAVSSIIETLPCEGPPQGKYLNCVAKIETSFSPAGLLSFLHDIEDSLGRVRRERYGPRTIDLDILLYGDFIVDEPGLVIPHPRMFEREFVLRPLFEIAPGAGEMLNRVRKRKEEELT